MNIQAIIPARGGSKEIPQKNIIPVAGKPLIAWTIEQSMHSRHIDHTLVSTNDNDIADISEKWGAEIIWRPNELCTDTASTESAILHALDDIRKRGEQDADIVVLLQATSPLRKRGDIDGAIDQFLAESADSLFSGSPLEDFLFWEKQEHEWVSVNYDYKNRGRRQDRSPQFVENGSIYLFKPEIIKKCQNRIGGRLSLYMMDFWQTWEIDAREDISLVEYYLNTYIKREACDELRHSRIDLIVFDFDGVFTDNKVLTLQDGVEGVIANRGDGLAVSALREMKYPMLILSTEGNAVVQSRAKKMQLPCLNGIHDKKQALEKYCADNNINREHTIYIGNDVNDLNVMRSVGWPLCPQDAHEEIKNAARLVLSSKGGEGVVRELWEMLKNS